jgi:hypothetical protein
MTIGELWDALAQYPDDMQIYIGYIDGHSIMQEEFNIIITTSFGDEKSISLMVEDINIINN